VFERNTSTKKAFTLTEMLIGLVLLGVIASFAVPYIVMSADRIQKRAVFNETYQALSEAVHSTWLEGGTQSDLIKKLNPLKVCNTNARTEGCTQSVNPEADQAGIVLATGVTISGFNFNFDQDSTVVGQDGYIIGLEDSNDKEYYRVMMNNGENVYDSSWARAEHWDPNHVRVDTLIRPGELKCVEQACLDMLNNT
jgi:prepilin-type N-terminal cleavage/methylation domain-containing protein